MYKKLCKDDTPMVRRAAGTHLGKFAAKVEKEELKSKLVPLFHLLKEDPQDSVRLLAVESCVAFANLLTQSEAIAHVLPTIKSCARDESWRVRYMIADHFKSVRVRS